ncbi:MAG TPA: PAS domain S-box protein, partial [Chitinophagaceae bacterium]|nr:PAS domain S-box protein [Chitinophagaceae bacterium]
LMLVSGSIFFANPNVGMLADFNRSTVSAMLAFRNVIITLIILLVISWLRMKGENAGWYSTGFGLAIMIVLFTISIFYIVWWQTKKINSDEGDKEKLYKALQEKDAFNRGILSSLKASVAVIDGDGKIIMVNKAWENFAAENGVTTLERVGRGSNYFSVCSRAAAHGDQIAAEALQGIMAVLNKQTKLFELQYPCHSQVQQRWFLLRVMPFENGTQTIVVSHNDITEIVLSRVKTEESEANLRQIMDNSSGMIASIDRHHRMIVFNRATANEYKQYCGEELKPGMIHYKVFPPDGQALWKAKIDETLAGTAAMFERIYEIVGKKKYAEICLYPIRKGNEVEGVTCFIADITERKLAELENEESRKKYYSLYENSAEGILLTIPDGDILAANKAACEIFGMTEEEICKAGREGVVDITDPNLPLLLQERRLTGKASGELTFKRKDGSKFSGEITSVLFKDASGNERSSMIIRDISARKAAEQLVKISEARLKKAQQIAHIGSWYYSFRENKLQWSDEAYSIFGVSVESFVPTAESFVQLIHPDDRKVVQEHLQSFNSGINPGELKCRVILKDESVRYINGRGDIKFDNDGKPVSITGTMQDITSMKLAEQKVAESENRLRTIFNTEPECIKLLNEKGELLDMNPAGLAMLEADNLDIIKGASCFSIVKPAYRDAFARLHKQVFEGKTGNLQFEITGMKGTDRWLESHAVPMRDAEGNIITMLSVTRDVTAQKKAEEEKFRLLGVLQKSLNEIYIFDSETLLFEYVNDAALKNLGYSMEVMTGMSPLDIKPEFNPGKLKKLVSPLVNHEKEKIIFETIHKRADGSMYPVEAHLQLITQDGHSVFLAVIQDITVRKKTEQELRESEALLKDVTASLPGIVYRYVTGADGKIRFLFLSEGIRRYQEDSVEDIYKDSSLLFSKIHPEDFGRLMAGMAESNKSLERLTIIY